MTNSNENEIQTATIFRTWVELAESLTDSDRGKFYHAICRYALFGEEPQLNGVMNAYFALIRPTIEKSNRRKIAQQLSRRKREENSQNASQNNPQTNLQTATQNNLQPGLQTAPQSNPQPCLQTALQTAPQSNPQNVPSRAQKTGTGKGTEKEKVKKESISFSTMLPEKLQTPKFIKKWTEWEQYRRSKRKPISPAAAALQIKLLSNYDETTAIQIIDFSIASDYQGLFPPKNRPVKPQKDYSSI